MRKWTKGFLIFGVVTTVIGFILLFVGIQSDGIKSLLSMSKEPIYDSRTEKLTFGKEVENLEITLHQHALTITDSFDDQIHISYHPSLSAHHDLITNQNDRTLSLTDKKLSETPFLLLELVGFFISQVATLVVLKKLFSSYQKGEL
ncbi:Uncharacterised protein [Streptococcus pneumoniae]|nr:Uncharacterised protein [Streptococcus pneumoniae]